MNKIFLFISLTWSLGAIASTEDLQQLTQKLNSVKNLQAQFTQANPNGQTLQGKFYLQKPGKMRFEYKAPAKFLVLADGKWLIYHDIEMHETSYLDLDKNPLALLLKENVDLNHLKDVQIKNATKHAGRLSVEVFYPQENTTVILHFNEHLILEGWTTHDPQGNIVEVHLKDVILNQPITNAQKLFSFERSKRERVKRGDRA